MWAFSNFSYFPMRYLSFISCIQMFCSIMLETTSSSTLQFFISSESSNQCFCEKEASFRTGLSNTFLCPNQCWLVGSSLKDTQGRSCTVRLLLLSVNSVHRKEAGRYIFSITSSLKRPTSFPLNVSLIRGVLIWLPLPLSDNGSEWSLLACLLDFLCLLFISHSCWIFTHRNHIFHVLDQLRTAWVLGWGMWRCPLWLYCSVPSQPLPTSQHEWWKKNL